MKSLVLRVTTYELRVRRLRLWPCRRLGILGRLGTSAGGALSLGERALAEDEDAHAVSDKLN